MWRSIFIAVGMMAIIVGFECLIIDSATFYSADQTQLGRFFNPMRLPALSTRIWEPQEWFPWVFLSSGAITVLYAITLPKRWNRAAA